MLAPFERNVPSGSTPQDPGPRRPGDLDGRPIFDGSGWVVDRDRHVDCHVDATAYRLRIGGIGTFRVALDGRFVGRPRTHPGADGKLAQLALLGPALTLALALQGTFCLHASAVEVESGVLAFAGESGAGKSTLARMLIESSVLGRRHAADDILPVDFAAGQPARWAGAHPMARSDFPQLKLPSGEQPYLTGPSSLPLRAVFLLQPPKPPDTVRIEKLTASHSTLALIRHTVAARLFDARLLEDHLRFSADVAQRIPVCRLSYPWQPESLPLIAEALAADRG